MRSETRLQKWLSARWLRVLYDWPLGVLESLSPPYYLPDTLACTEDLFSADPLSLSAEAGR